MGAACSSVLGGCRSVGRRARDSVNGGPRDPSNQPPWVARARHPPFPSGRARSRARLQEQGGLGGAAAAPAGADDHEPESAVPSLLQLSVSAVCRGASHAYCRAQPLGGAARRSTPPRRRAGPG